MSESKGFHQSETLPRLPDFYRSGNRWRRKGSSLREGCLGILVLSSIGVRMSETDYPESHVMYLIEKRRSGI